MDERSSYYPNEAFEAAFGKPQGKALSGRAAGHRHAEAFMLMKYQSDDGSITEWIWNSRDGVTPFCVMPRGASSRAQMMRHVEFHRDRYEPERIPAVGDRIFVNLTLDKAREYRRRWYETAKDMPEWRPYLEGEEPEAHIEKLAQADFKSFGAGTSPDLVVVTEEIRAEFARKAEAALERALIAEKYEDLDALRRRRDELDEEIRTLEKELKVHPARRGSMIEIARDPVPPWVSRKKKGRR
jgi:hypothetical protein